MNEFKTKVNADERSKKFMSDKFLLDDSYLLIYLRYLQNVTDLSILDVNIIIQELGNGTWIKPWMFCPSFMIWESTTRNMLRDPFLPSKDIFKNLL